MCLNAFGRSGRQKRTKNEANERSEKVMQKVGEEERKITKNNAKMRRKASTIYPFGAHGHAGFVWRGVFFATRFSAPPRGHPWSRFGSILGPFGIIWAHLGSILLPSGTLLLPFCLPGVHFGTLRSL